MRFTTAIFDLDGTLLDSLDDITAAGNAAMAAVGRPAFPREAYRALAGQGRPYLIEHALGPDHQHLYDDALAAHGTYYAAHLGEHSRPFDGITEMLEGLKGLGMKRAVLSNKPHDLTLQDVGHFFGRDTFDLVVGHRDGYPVKPDPTSAREMLNTLGTTADRVVYVGDTAADMQTGKATGFFTVGVTWGFRDRKELKQTGADTIIDEPAQLLEAMSSASNASQSA